MIITKEIYDSFIDAKDFLGYNDCKLDSEEQYELYIKLDNIKKEIIKLNDLKE